MNFQVHIHVCACVGRVLKVSVGDVDILFWRPSRTPEDFGWKKIANNLCKILTKYVVHAALSTIFCFNATFFYFNNNTIAFVHLKQQTTPYFSGKIHSEKYEHLTFMLWSICFSRISSWAFSCSNSELLFCSFFFSFSLAANYVSGKSNRHRSQMKKYKKWYDISLRDQL